MKRLVCLVAGHRTIPVKRVGTAARPGGILPSVDGFATYISDSSGEHLACTRCRQVVSP